MPFTRVWEYKAEKWQWVPRDGKILDDANQDITGKDSTIYYVPDNTALGRDEYKASGTIGNHRHANQDLWNPDDDDNFDAYVLVLDGDENVNIDVKLSVKDTSQTGIEKFKFSLVELDWQGGKWIEWETLDEVDVSKWFPGKTFSLSAKNVEQGSPEDPVAYLFKIEQIPHNYGAEIFNSQLDYSLDILI